MARLRQARRVTRALWRFTRTHTPRWMLPALSRALAALRHRFGRYVGPGYALSCILLALDAKRECEAARARGDH